MFGCFLEPPFPPHLYSNYNTGRHCFTSLSLSKYSCLPLTVNFSVEFTLFYSISHLQPSQLYISCSFFKIQGQTFREGGAGLH